MATFEAQVEALTSLSIDGSSSPTQSELTQFLTDGAKEVLNSLPRSKKLLYTTSNDLNSSSVNLTIGGSEIFSVTRDDGTINQPCRQIPANMSGRVSDSSDMSAATATDPVYFIVNNILSVIPEPSNSNNAHVQTLNYPSVAFGDSAIAKFPDEAEYLVPLYGAIKSLQNLLASKSSNADITTALTAINTEVDECLAVADLINTQVDSAVTELAEAATNVDASVDTAVAAITTALGRVNTAVVLANAQFDLINPEVDLANAEVDNDDVEVAQGYLGTAQGYANAGSSYIQEAQTALAEAQGYAGEVSARSSQVSAQVNVAQGYIGAAQGYSSEIQSKISIANGYISEVQSRLSVDSTQYSFYEKQQAKLQSDYDKGIQALQ